MDEANIQEASKNLTELSASAFQGQYESTVVLLRSQLVPQRKIEALSKNMFEFTDLMLAKITGITKPACGKGCYYCCHVMVSATSIEVLALRRYLLTVKSEEELREIRARLESYVILTKELSSEDVLRKKVPCPFLVNKNCSIHVARPMSCRWTFAMNSSECKSALEGEGDGSIDVDLQSLSWGRSVVFGAQRAFQEFGLDAAAYELHSALLIALNDPEIEFRWLQGEKVFAVARSSAELILHTN